MHFLQIPFAFEIQENTFAVKYFSSGGRGRDLSGEKHCILRVGHKRVVEVGEH